GRGPRSECYEAPTATADLPRAARSIGFTAPANGILRWRGATLYRLRAVPSQPPQPMSSTSRSVTTIAYDDPSGVITFTSCRLWPPGRFSQREAIRPSASTHGLLSLLKTGATASG